MAFTVHKIGSGEHVGAVDVSNIDLLSRSATVGAYLLPTARGQGFATDAVRLACSYAFDNLALHRLKYGTFATNTASLELARRCGFVEEGRRRKAKWTSRGWVDSVALAMLDEEWAALRMSRIRST